LKAGIIVNKISLTDNSGHWFDKDAAKEWRAAAHLVDGGPAVSRATGKSWEHETLYLTSHGSFVMHFADDHNPTHAQYVPWEDDQAIKWLVANGYNDEAEKLGLAKLERKAEV
jgi:hypothetical protein